MGVEMLQVFLRAWWWWWWLGRWLRERVMVRGGFWRAFVGRGRAGKVLWLAVHYPCHLTVPQVSSEKTIS